MITGHFYTNRTGVIKNYKIRIDIRGGMRSSRLTFNEEDIWIWLYFFFDLQYSNNMVKLVNSSGVVVKS